MNEIRYADRSSRQRAQGMKICKHKSILFSVNKSRTNLEVSAPANSVWHAKVFLKFLAYAEENILEVQMQSFKDFIFETCKASYTHFSL